jgi:hypothetical protein
VIRNIAERNEIDRISRLVPDLILPREYTLSFMPLAGGLVILVLGEVFRQGARLRADVEGLV